MLNNESLYNKYRPKTFKDFIGTEQKRVASLLETMIAEGKIPSAILFYGDHGAGKTSMARVLSMSLNCDSEQERPCGNCTSCKEALSNPETHLTIINASDVTGVDSIRKIIEDISKKDLLHTFKVVVFDEMHNLSRQAQDCLLTITEFPPENTVIVFCTTELTKVRSTLRSRCLEGGFHFSTPPRTEILSLLNEISFQETGKQLPRGIHFPSFSSVRHAVSLLESFLTTGRVPGTPEEEKGSEPPWKSFIRAFLSTSNSSLTRKDLAKFLEDFRKDPITTRSAIAEYLHSVLINVMKGYSRIDPRYVVLLIKIITRNDPKSLPVLLAVDICDMMKLRRKYLEKKPLEID